MTSESLASSLTETASGVFWEDVVQRLIADFPQIPASPKRQEDSQPPLCWHYCWPIPQLPRILLSHCPPTVRPPSVRNRTTFRISHVPRHPEIVSLASLSRFLSAHTFSRNSTGTSSFYPHCHNSTPCRRQLCWPFYVPPTKIQMVPANVRARIFYYFFLYL